MHTALWKLYRLRVRGSVRSIVARLKSVRGAAMAVFTVLILGAMFGPNLVMGFTFARDGVMGRAADSLREALPALMLLYVVLNLVTSLGERAIGFSPSEVDFLFPAPFSRRQVLLYKILGNVTGAALVALVAPAWLLIYLRSWPAAAAGFFLAALMVNSLTMCAQLVAQSVTQRAFTRARQLLLVGLVAAAAAALGHAAARGLEGGWQETLLEARHAPVAEIVLAPFAVFANIITAERLVPDALGWTALGAIMVVGVYTLAIRLDADYVETAVRVSRKMQELKRRAMSGGALNLSSHRAVRSSRLPQPPWLGGAGPLIWRQAIQLLRGSRRALVLTLIMVGAMGVPFVIGSRDDKNLPAILPAVVIGITAYMTFLLSSQAPVGFRGDYQRMDLLKSLPTGALAMAFGQTLGVVTIMTLLQSVVFAATAVVAPAGAAKLLVAGLFALPFNWLLFGTDNFLFLLYPSPPLASGSEGFLKMGRAMLLLLAKSVVFGVCGIVALVPAAVVYFITESLPAACVVAWLALLYPAIGILLLVAWAFQRYDVNSVSSE